MYKIHVHVRKKCASLSHTKTDATRTSNVRMEPHETQRHAHAHVTLRNGLGLIEPRLEFSKLKNFNK